MYKVLLIDDDALMLKYLSGLIQWDELGISKLLQTYSSVKALELFKQEQPDIVITDIGLPQINGLQLADQFKRMKPDVRIVFLTCHEEFQYLKQAMNMNADEYLLKDKLFASQLEETLLKSMKALQQHAVQEARDSYQEDFIRNLDVLKTSFFDQLAGGGTDEQAAVQYARRLGVKWRYPSFKLGIGHIQQSSLYGRYAQKDMELLRYSVYNIASEISERHEGISAFRYRDYLMVLMNYRNTGTGTPQQDMERYMVEVQRQVESFLKIQIRFVCCMSELTLGGIADAYKRWQRERWQLFYKGTDLLLWRWDRHCLLYPVPGSLKACVKKVESAALEGTEGAVMKLLEEMGREASEKFVQPLEWIALCTELMRSLEVKLSVRAKDELFYLSLDAAMSSDELIGLLRWRMNELMEQSDKPQHSKRSEPKLQAIDHYIMSHMSDNISSIDIAHFLGLNPSYFSRYFKRLTGMNITDYMHRYKVGVAEQLLRNSDEKVELVAAKLGYYERSYFSKVFKKYTGLTPTELREKIK